MAKNYFTLLVREPNESWVIAFGDYDRSVVAQEGDDMKRGSDWVKGSKLKIIETSPKQKDIQKAVDALNGIAEPECINYNTELAAMRKWIIDERIATKKILSTWPDSAVIAIYMQAH